MSADRKKRHPLSSFQFSRSSSFQDVAVKLQPSSLPREFLVTPDRLETLAAIQVDKLKLPFAIFWTKYCVENLMTLLGFAHYSGAFDENMVNGRALLLVDASALVKMNITKLEDIKIIAKQLRKIYELDCIFYKRSISLPPRYPLTHCKQYFRQTGPKYEFGRFSDLLRKMKLIHDFPQTEDHWTQLENWRKHEPKREFVRIGYARRNKLYTEGRSLLKKTPAKQCDCIPPCECRWTKRDIREPWTLSCLLRSPKETHDKLPTDRVEMCNF